MTDIARIHETFKNVTSSVNSYGAFLNEFSFPFGAEILKGIESHESKLINQICTSFESYNDIISNGPRPEELPTDTNRRHLRHFLDKFGLRVDKRVFESIREDLLIEVYSHTHQQLYRSVNFFSLSEYSLPELTFSSWDQLFHRSKKDEKVMFQNIDVALEGEVEFMTPNIPAHILEELKTQKKFRYEMVKVACVFDEVIQAPMGYLTMISVKELKGKLNLVH